MNSRVALITGSNKGLGFECAKLLGKKGIKIILTARDIEKGKSASEKLKKDGIDVVFHKLDVTRQKDVDDIFEFVKNKFANLGILVNNAGISIDGNKTVENLDIDSLNMTMETNFVGAFMMTQKIVPLMITDDAYTAFRKIMETGIDLLPVYDKKKIMGFVSKKAVLHRLMWDGKYGHGEPHLARRVRGR